MNKNEPVLCVPDTRIRGEDADILKLIKSDGILVKRSLAEKDDRLRQVIPYIACQCQQSRFDDDVERFWLYKRRTGEPKLKAKYSIGIGGHLNSFNYRREAARELYEETGVIQDKEDFRPLGLLIEDEFSGVGKYHIGVVHKLPVWDYSRFTPKRPNWSPSKETSDGKWASKEEIMDVEEQLERWSYTMLHVYL